MSTPTFKKTLLLCMATAAMANSFAQKCGRDFSYRLQSGKHPGAVEKMVNARAERLKEFYDSRKDKAHTAQKTTATIIIPVVFHLVLTEDQVDEMGGIKGIEDRIKTQIEALNEDFTGTNADTVNIPDDFKPLIGNANFKFALARRKPDSTAFIGYEIKETTTDGLEYFGVLGSQGDWSDMKYDGPDGLPQWDYNRYLNIWVGKLTFFGGFSPIIGVCTPPEAVTLFNVPPEEQGIVIQHYVLGKQTKASQVFIPGLTEGRTLVHETGHYFGLYHVWGNVDQSCTDDDGIADTPEQFESSNDCPSYPTYDNCTSTGAGIMYMNHMDYASDACNLMFTKEQAAFMISELAPGKPLHELGQHPELTEPLAIETVSNKIAVSVGPNPTDGTLVVKLPATGKVCYAEVVDMMGRVVLAEMLPAGQHEHLLSIAGQNKGIYIVNIKAGELVSRHKIILR